MDSDFTSSEAITITRRWLSGFVIGLNLCPFAGQEVAANRIAFRVISATSPEAILESLGAALVYLEEHPEVETLLLIYPRALQDFLEYLDVLPVCDELLSALGLEGIFQIASFHPNYQFADTEASDAANYSNRSPFPMLHILREHSVSRAVASHPAIDDIPVKNIARLTALGADRLKELWLECFLVQPER